MVCQVGDGHCTNFWMDRWVPNGSLLMPIATNQLIDSTLMVKDVVTHEGKCDLNFLYNNLPQSIVHQVVALSAPKETDGPDLGLVLQEPQQQGVWSANRWVEDHFYVLMAKDIDKYEHEHLTIGQQRRDTIYIGWKSPPEGWIKLNCDGAYKKVQDVAGVAAYFETHLVVGYRDILKRLEVVTPYMLKCGVWNCNLNGATPILIRRIQELISRNWQIQFKHTRREGNLSGDWLVNHSFTHNPFDVMMLETPPRELQSILFDDISGVCMSRIVRIAR
ncbi:hypothetical protein L195_g043145 [Trifolium pratense]|uniref:Uncharacterized protein n=1 Tax=Trifolium pratense TaxID=57577 RepID=A0A2K3M8F3_TRIPR|nr:hypothetical protein L195_g043145 [Trifolium pratense]